jgi:hypothetical protein
MQVAVVALAQLVLVMLPEDLVAEVMGLRVLVIPEVLLMHPVCLEQVMLLLDKLTQVAVVAVALEPTAEL